MPLALNAGGVVAPMQRQYDMDTGKLDEAGQRPVGGQGGGPRPGQSGEGSRSALEHLIQQEQRRIAQLPRDGDAGPSEAAA